MHPFRVLDTLRAKVQGGNEIRENPVNLTVN